MVSMARTRPFVAQVRPGVSDTSALAREARLSDSSRSNDERPRRRRCGAGPGGVQTWRSSACPHPLARTWRVELWIQHSEREPSRGQRIPRRIRKLAETAPKWSSPDRQRVAARLAGVTGQSSESGTGTMVRLERGLAGWRARWRSRRGRRRGDPKISSADLLVERVRPGQEADRAQRLVLPGRLQDELAVAEQPAQDRPVVRHVGDLDQRHHRDPAGEDAVGQDAPACWSRRTSRCTTRRSGSRAGAARPASRAR